MVYNRIQVAFGSLKRITGPTINYQYDVKQILVINGLNLPEYYVVDFCNEGDATVIPMTGTSDGVEIPDSLLQTGKPVKAYIVVSSGQGDIQTRYEVKLPVNTRPMRDDIHPTDPQQQQIDALVAALNSGVARAEEAVEHYPRIIDGCWYLWDGDDEEYVPTGIKAEGTDGVSPTVTVAEITGGHRITITDKNGTRTVDVMDGTDGKDGKDGSDGKDGTDGYSPTITVTDITGGHRVTVTDKNGTRTFDVMNGTDGKDGKDGKDGTDGDDGYSPVVTITSITGGHRVTITDEDHPQGQSFDVMDGQDGGDVSACAPVIINTASGDIASFTDGADNRQIKKIVGTIVPVQSGTGDPSPDNVRPISGWTGANIAGTGVNILDIRYGKELPYTASGITFTEVANGGVQISGKATSNVFWNASFNGSVGQPCDKFRGQHIYFSYGNAVQGVDTKTGYINTAGTITTFNNGNVLGNDAKYFRFYIQIASGSDFTTPVTIYPQIEIGTARTVFEPFGTTLPINWQTEAGTIYGGTVTLNEDGSADVVATWAGKEFDGVNNKASIPNTSYIGNVVTRAYKGAFSTNAKSPVNAISESAPYSTTGTDVQRFYITPSNGETNIFILNSLTGITTQDTAADAATKMNAYLAEHPFRFIYELATPESPIHIPNIGQLYTYLGTNNVWIDTGNVSECDYPADTKLYIDNKIAEAIAAL